MRWTRLASISLIVALLGCNPPGDDDPDGGATGDARVDDGGQASDGGATPDGGPADGGSADGGPADGGPVGDAAVLTADPVALNPTPLFNADGAPAEAAAAALIDAWSMRPTNDAEAQAQTAAKRAAAEALVAAGAAGADALAERCAGQPSALSWNHQLCARLLTLVESPASLAYLDGLARADDLARPMVPDPHTPNPAALSRSAAGWALERRAAAGSQAALDVLIAQVRTPERPAVRRAAVHGLLRARPRHRVKPRLRAILPPAEHWMLFEVRR